MSKHYGLFKRTALRTRKVNLTRLTGRGGNSLL